MIRQGEGRLAVLLGVGEVHLRQRPERLDHRVADQVGEGHLAAAAARRWLLMTIRLSIEQLGRDRADAGGGGHGQAGRHVLHGAGRGAAQPADLGALRWRRGGGAAGACGAGAAGRGCSAGGAREAGAGAGGWSRGRRGRRGPHRSRLPGRRRGLRGRRGGLEVDDRLRARPVRQAGLVVGEEAPPRPVDRARVREVTLVKLVDQPFVGAEVGLSRGGFRCGGLTLRPGSPAGSCDSEDTADIGRKPSSEDV